MAAGCEGKLCNSKRINSNKDPPPKDRDNRQDSKLQKIKAIVEKALTKAMVATLQEATKVTAGGSDGKYETLPKGMMSCLVALTYTRTVKSQGRKQSIENLGRMGNGAVFSGGRSRVVDGGISRNNMQEVDKGSSPRTSETRQGL